MKSTLQFFLCLFLFNTSFSQDRKGQFYLESGSNSHDFYIAFKPHLFQNQELTNLLTHHEEWNTIREAYDFTLKKGIYISEEKLDNLKRNALIVSGNSEAVNRLEFIYKINTVNNSNQELYELAIRLEQLDFVEYCALISTDPIKPPYDIPPVTPNFEANQTYIGSDPGLNMQYAWDLGLAGSGIKVRNVEYGFNKNHEDLHQVNAFIASGMTINSTATQEYVEHGTPVFGIIMAHKGNYGISGLAHEVEEMVLFPEWQQIGYNRVYAVSQSIENSELGDVIIYEMQTSGYNPTSENPKYVPAEYNNIIWDLTKAASDAGIVVVAAGGNGGQNLDSNNYLPYMNRGNSGAIIVGAGFASTLHNRISYSTYGSRINLQGWGNNVFACGYGDVIMIENDFNQAYTNFSGTSSATPLVASCAIVLLSYHHQLTGEWLTSSDLIDIMQTTGIPQGNPSTGNIGPLPNMQAAIELVYENYTMSLPETEISQISFEIYPNPAHTEINFLRNSDFNSETKYEIINMLGQKVSDGILLTDFLSVKHLESGVYFIKITSKNKSGIRKFIKK
ncbi:MAG TPA: S8 family peptidase [Flavobacterium sp.]|nr:S8 family peptidase [Flavobacterium sp.]